MPLSNFKPSPFFFVIHVFHVLFSCSALRAVCWIDIPLICFRKSDSEGPINFLIRIHLFFFSRQITSTPVQSLLCQALLLWLSKQKKFLRYKKWLCIHHFDEASEYLLEYVCSRGPLSPLSRHCSIFTTVAMVSHCLPAWMHDSGARPCIERLYHVYVGMSRALLVACPLGTYLPRMSDPRHASVQTGVCNMRPHFGTHDLGCLCSELC